MLQKDMQERFQDVLKMKILNWMIDLSIFKQDGYHSFCLQKQISDLYPGLWRMVRKFLSRCV
ncbi:hypothetical protein T05_6344 [Trichinella murrelli]|uniref:Uncharacterized protein n=1 Tax=Trichinella murrelli TaxID=144512 RepID=A0A0V0SRL3_9BILA|nr:hypothetical protein T05_6344 [Trichinella murrelli]